MIETGKILTLGLIAVVLSTSAAAQEETASGSLDPGLIPGDFFYPVESFAERLEVSIAGFLGGENFKAKAMANNAQEKLSEAEKLAEKNRTEKAAEMTERYAEEMNRSREIAERNGNKNLSGRLNNISRKNIEKMEKVKEKVPDKAGKKIEEAINRSKKKEKPSGPQKDLADKPGKGKIPSKNTEKNPNIPDNPPDNETRGNEKAGKTSNKTKELLKEEEGRLRNSLNNSNSVFDAPENSRGSEKDKDTRKPSTGSSSGSEEEKGSENPLEKGGKGLL